MHADKNAEDNNQEVDADRRPVLFFHMVDEAVQQHGQPSESEGAYQVTRMSAFGKSSLRGPKSSNYAAFLLLGLTADQFPVSPTPVRHFPPNFQI